jgi:hypothetical protein
MALGIKKITESVIEDGRGLTMIGSYNGSIKDKDGVEVGAIENFKENRAVPIGAILTATNAPSGAALRVKIGEYEQARIDANATLGLGTVTERILADESVTNVKIRDGAVTTNKIMNLNVTTAKLASQSVITDKIANNAVTTAKLGNESVTAAKIANLNVVTDKIANEAVTTAKLANQCVTTIKLGDSSVTGAKIANNSIDFYKLIDGAVIESKLADDSVSTSKVQNGAITEAKIDSSFLIKLKEQIKAQTDSQINNALNIFAANYKLNNTVKHDGQRNVNGSNDSTAIINLKCTGDIEGNRVYFMTYQDLAEGYIPGEQLESGDIVAMHEDGKVYKADAYSECIVGVVSNEFANCLGATKEELFNGSKVAVGMIGKVHVKVKGPVSLGQKIGMSISDPGVGIAGYMNNNIGKALETIDCDFDEVHEVLVQIRPM